MNRTSRGLAAFIALATGLFTAAGAYAETPGAIESARGGFRIHPATKQLVLGIAPNWNSSRVTLRRYQRARDGSWRQLGDPVPGRLGREGLVWGLGLHPVPPGQRLKREGDGRAPAGAFRIGGAYGYAPDVRRRATLPYHQVTAADLWVEDSESPHYNRHLRLRHASPKNGWEKKQQMKQDDPAHALKLFVEHNAGERVVPAGGSAIFFHIWRDNGARPSAGCTVLAEKALRELVAWVDPRFHPVYVLLPQAEYRRLRGPWRLP